MKEYNVNKHEYDVIVIGAGGSGLRATLGLAQSEHSVACISKVFPTRSHTVAAQGGISGALGNMGEDDWRWHMYDTVKGSDWLGDQDSIEYMCKNAVESIIELEHYGVPFSRTEEGKIYQRPFGGMTTNFGEGIAQRTCAAADRTGHAILHTLYSQALKNNVDFFIEYFVLDLIFKDNKCIGVLAWCLEDGSIHLFHAHITILATGGYGNVYYLSTNAMGSNVTAIWKAYKKGAYFANPCFTQIHPTCIPVSGEYQSKLTLMSESLRNDGRIWVPKSKDDNRSPDTIPEDERDYYLERRYPAFGNLVPRDIASRAAKERCDNGFGVGSTGQAVYLDFEDAIKKHGREIISSRYGNLFEMYNKITGDDPYTMPMRIYPAVHYTMGGLWVDYNLMTTIPGLFSIGECNFSDHGANRLGASALMQGLADGYFILPYTIGTYLANEINKSKIDISHDAFDQSESRVLDTINYFISNNGNSSVDVFHRELGKIMWEHCGMSRNKSGLNSAINELKSLKELFWKDIKVPGESNTLNLELEKAGRVADLIELGEIMVRDALKREESCGAHFREEHQTKEGEALRNDGDFSNIFAWGYNGESSEPLLNIEELVFENVSLSQRSYK